MINKYGCKDCLVQWALSRIGFKLTCDGEGAMGRRERAGSEAENMIRVEYSNIDVRSNYVDMSSSSLVQIHCPP